MKAFEQNKKTNFKFSCNYSIAVLWVLCLPSSPTQMIEIVSKFKHVNNDTYSDLNHKLIQNGLKIS